MTWHPFHWLAKRLVPEVKPREAPMPPPSDHLEAALPAEKQLELEKAEWEVAHAFRLNEIALMTSAQQSHFTISAENRSRRMLEGLMQRMDKGAEP